MVGIEEKIDWDEKDVGLIKTHYMHVRNPQTIKRLNKVIVKAKSYLVINMQSYMLKLFLMTYF